MTTEDMPISSLSPQEEETLHTLLTDLPTAEPPADLTERILAAVAAEAAEKPRLTVTSGKKRPVFHWKQMAALAAALSLALVGIYPTLNRNESQVEPYAAEVQAEIGSDVPFQGRSVVIEPTVDSSESIATTSLEAGNGDAVGEGFTSGYDPSAQIPLVTADLDQEETVEAATPLPPERAALECLVNDWFLAGSSYLPVATYLDTAPISCRISYTAEAAELPDSVVTYLGRDEAGFHFESVEEGWLPNYFTVTPEGEILVEGVDVPTDDLPAE